MTGKLNNRRGVLMFLVALIALLFFAGDHPLLDHWGDVATSSKPFLEFPQPPGVRPSLDEAGGEQ